MTEEQKRELESLFNYYSYHKALNNKLGYEEDEKKNNARMWALRHTFKILGYAFRFEKTETENNIEYDVWKLVEREK